MSGFVYLVGAVYVASTVARFLFWAVDVIEAVSYTHLTLPTIGSV